MNRAFIGFKWCFNGALVGPRDLNIFSVSVVLFGFTGISIPS